MIVEAIPDVLEALMVTPYGSTLTLDSFVIEPSDLTVRPVIEVFSTYAATPTPRYSIRLVCGSTEFCLLTSNKTLARLIFNLILENLSVREQAIRNTFPEQFI